MCLDGPFKESDGYWYERMIMVFPVMIAFSMRLISSRRAVCACVSAVASSVSSHI